VVSVQAGARRSREDAPACPPVPCA
jgi:hypothetical protein